ncbi:hypothetical protein PENFLA_c002G03951 [Penicillium flavigenum]|uniref:Uncharacterized protein n=1 Tax=Penicillium flavigenum TaxID=254877 RepID=A0A1V6TX60_9EURO|nr:hypothetical protein PENFLA_c002G03951 [Penicillium flavigenum]
MSAQPSNNKPTARNNPTVINTAATTNINANANTEPLGPTSTPATDSIYPWLSNIDTPGNLDDDAQSFGSDIPYEGKSQEPSQSTGYMTIGHKLLPICIGEVPVEDILFLCPFHHAMPHNIDLRHLQSAVTTLGEAWVRTNAASHTSRD